MPPMLRNARLIRHINRFTPVAARHSRRAKQGRHNKLLLTGSAFYATTVALWFHLGDHVSNDSETESIRPEISKIQHGTAIIEENNLGCLVWGSNRNSLIVPDTSKSVHTPQPSPSLVNTALRDMKLHETHGACIDAQGDVYQWGSGFSKDNVKPQRTLSGLDVSDLSLTDCKVYALSRKSGKIYAIASNKEKQHPPPGSKGSWVWLTGKGNSAIDYVEITPQCKLRKNEKFVSIQTGSDHLVALTSTGRTFTMPTSLRANSRGQLGYRKSKVRMTNSSSELEQIELMPDAVRDPLAMATPFRRGINGISGEQQNGSSNRSTYVLDSIEQHRRAADDKSIRFCTTLLEVPSLRGIVVSQIATSRRSTYARVEGRVLAWGANEFGQLGLGSNISLPYVTVPTEISFARNTSPSTSSSCLSISAAGDIAYFLVKRQGSGLDNLINEVLACGQGQWGALGNGLFSSAQADPMRIKAVSGIMEFSEQDGKVLPIEIHSITTSPTGHTMLAFDTLARGGPGGVSGRDMVIWGQNKDYELGNGKRGIRAIPEYIRSSSDIRFMLNEKVAEIKDMSGKRWAKKALVRQTPVGGYSCSVVYWKIVE